VPISRVGSPDNFFSVRGAGVAAKTIFLANNFKTVKSQ
jgi:hypothetical protein